MTFLGEMVGAKIKALRMAKGLSQRDLAIKASLHPAQLSKYERGTQVPGDVALIRIAGGLGVEVDELIYQELVVNEGGFNTEILKNAQERERILMDEIKRLGAKVEDQAAQLAKKPK